VFNALAAIAVARRFGVDHQEIAERLATFSLPPMRLECRRIGDLVLINDAYNASPSSMAAAVEVLCDMPAAGRRVLVMGDMRELGGESERLHREAAERIAASPVDLVIAVGERAKLVTQTIKKASGGRIEVHASATTDAARRRLLAFLRRDDTIMVKGSRALGLEKLADAIREWSMVGCQ